MQRALPSMTAILFFTCAEGAGIGIIALVGGRGREKNHQTAPRPLSSFDTHERWQPITQSTLSQQSYRKYRTVNSLNENTTK